MSGEGGRESLDTEPLDLLEQRQAWAEELESMATNQTVKWYVQLARKFLDDAKTWLVECEDGGNATLPAMVNASITSATEQLAHVEKTLAEHGPHTPWIGR